MILNKFIIVLITILSINLSYSQNEATFLDAELEIYGKLLQLKCEGNEKMHSYINKFGAFHMVDSESSEFSTYKLDSRFNEVLNVSIYNDVPGFRFETTDHSLYTYIIEEGTFVKRHQEGNTFFLIYKVQNHEVIVHKYEYREKMYYLIDSYCYE